MPRLSSVISDLFMVCCACPPERTGGHALLFLFPRLYGSYNSVNDVVHHLNICLRMRHAARHDGERYHGCACLLGDAFRYLFRELRFPHDNRNVPSLHRADQFLDVTRSRIDTGSQFDCTEVLHPEPLREIRPVLMIGYELCALERFDLLLPFSNLGVEFCEISIAVMRELRLVLRGKLYERVIDISDRDLR